MSYQTAVDAVLPDLRANAEEVDSEAMFPKASLDAIRSAGLMGITSPAEVGGRGLGPEDFADILTQLATACGSTAMVLLMHHAASAVVAASPPPGRPGLVESMARGDVLGTLAFSERGSRSHFWAPMSVGVPGDDGAIAICAEKTWVTSAGAADMYVVSCRKPGAATPTESSLYAVPASTPGMGIGPAFDGLGLRGNASSPMSIDIEIDEDLRIGQHGQGFTLMLESVLPWFNLGNAAITLGLAKGAIDAALGHVKSSTLQHLSVNLADLPTIRTRLAKAEISLRAQQAYLAETARHIATQDSEMLMYVLGARASCNDAAIAITDECMRVCGGAAFSKYLPIERMFRDARAGHIMAPTSDVLYDLYGKALCGLDLF